MGCTNSSNNNIPVQIAAYQGMVQSIIDYCSQNNAYVILDLHWSGTYASTTSTTPCTGAGWKTSTGQQDMPDGNSVTFWSSVAGTSWIKNNPAVLFDLYNEPIDPTYTETAVKWDVWLNGGATGGTPSTTPGMLALLSAIRDEGANNVVIAGGLNWAYDLRGVVGKQPGGGLSYPLTDTGTGYGVVYDAHVYPNKGVSGNFNPATDGVTYIDPCAAVYPVLISEFGESTSCLGDVSDGGAWDTTVTNWISTQPGINGGAAWAVNTNQCPALITSWTVPFPLTSNHGVPVTEWLATQVPTCPTGPTNTPTISLTPTFTLTLTSTPTLTYTGTPTLTASPTVTLTPTPTLTPVLTPTITSTPTSTGTATPTSTPSQSPTQTVTDSPTDTFTAGPTDTITLTPENTYTVTDTFTTTATNSFTASDTPTSTFTPTLTFTITNTPVESFTYTR